MRPGAKGEGPDRLAFGVHWLPLVNPQPEPVGPDLEVVGCASVYRYEERVLVPVQTLGARPEVVFVRVGHLHVEMGRAS